MKKRNTAFTFNLYLFTLYSMRNKANFQKSQMFITSINTTNYNEKATMDTWSKQTQTNPIYSEPVESIYGEQG
jgi:hypothetical protein